MPVIVHWITFDFEWKDEVLDFCEVIGPYIGENLAQILFECLEEYKCSVKVLTLTGDNASNNASLIRNLQLLLQYNSKFNDKCC